MTKKLEDGKYVDMTADEIQDLENLKNYHHNNMDILMGELRRKRDYLLLETDWTANSDVTMSAEMKEYRQKLRDATEGLDTVEKVKAYEFPTEVKK